MEENNIWQSHYLHCTTWAEREMAKLLQKGVIIECKREKVDSCQLFLQENLNL